MPDETDLIQRLPFMVLYRNWFQWALLGALWSAVYLGTITTPALFDDADTVHAEAVREMVETGDWTTLRINNGIRYLEKAPLMYWLSALSVKAFGLSDWAVRLPVALFALLLMILIHHFGSHFFGDGTGFYGALVYVTGLGPFAFTRIFLPDVMLALFIALSFYFYLQIAYEPEAPSKLMHRWDWRCLGLFASAGLAVLTKGLAGIVFVGLVIFAHLLLSGRWDVLKRLQIIPGIAVFLIITAPWHLAAGFSNDGFFWFYFINEHFLRYLGLRYPKDYDTVPRWLFWTLHLAWLFPWSVFAWDFARTFPRRLRPEAIRDQVNVFLYLWILLILTFFSFSTTQEYYTFPTLPAFALLLGQALAWIDSPDSGSGRRRAITGMAILAAVCFVASSGLFLLTWMGKTAGDPANVSTTLTANPDKYALSFGHVFDLTPATFGLLTPLVLRTAFLLLIGPVLALIAALRKRWRFAALCLALMMVGLLHSYHAGMVAFEPVLSSKSLAKVIEYHYQPGDLIVINGVYERGSSINYYTGIRTSILDGHFGNLWYGSFYADSPPIFYDDTSFRQVWSTSQRVFLFSEKEPLERFISKHPDFVYTVLASEGGKEVLVNW
jgi:4-amino-4-deoxy-L-arabinose transferase-like glycosyltransferase